MSEARTTITTLNHPSRRDIAAGGVAILLLGASTAGAAVGGISSASPDEELVAFAAEFMRLQKLIDPLTKRFFELKSDDPEIEVSLKRS